MTAFHARLAGSVGELSELLLAAEHAVDIAADALIRGRTDVKALIGKGDYGFTTVVDREIERLVRTRLREDAPGIPFFGEEEGGAVLLSDARLATRPDRRDGELR